LLLLLLLLLLQLPLVYHLQCLKAPDGACSKRYSVAHPSAEHEVLKCKTLLPFTTNEISKAFPVRYFTASWNLTLCTKPSCEK
jgi:hypothetical protein